MANLNKEACKALIESVSSVPYLIYGAFRNCNGDECALGTLGVSDNTRRDRGNKPWLLAERLELAEWNNDLGFWDLTDAGHRIVRLNDRNDRYVNWSETDEARRDRVLKWLKERLEELDGTEDRVD